MPTILLIDDEELPRKTTREFLELLGYRVEAVSGGRLGIETYDPQRHDAVLCDVRMSDVDGARVYRELRRRFDNLPFGFYSGTDGTPIEGVPCLSKPYRLSELRAYLLRLLDCAAA